MIYYLHVVAGDECTEDVLSHIPELLGAPSPQYQLRPIYWILVLRIEECLINLI
jgi:hypothetical protein